MSVIVLDICRPGLDFETDNECLFHSIQNKPGLFLAPPIKDAHKHARALFGGYAGDKCTDGTLPSGTTIKKKILQ